jgi:hypothetical protein
MTETRQIRTENYAIKRASEFRCERVTLPSTENEATEPDFTDHRCTHRDQLLACDVLGSGGAHVVLCPIHLAKADGRSVKVRPGQWDEAEALREELRKQKRVA